MTFEDRFAEIMERVHVPPTTKLWVHASLFGVVVSALCCAYIGLQSGWDGVSSFNRGVSNAAMILIGLSFIASGVCYFWDFADKLIVNRKYVGLTGFWLVSVHGFVSLAQKKYDLGYFLLPQNIVAFLSAVAAMAIFVMMALISNTFSVKKLGGKRWRAMLRVGYLAYVFAIIHMLIKVAPQWSQSVSSGGLPPLSALTALFGVSVVIMRLVLMVVLMRKKSLAK